VPWERGGREWFIDNGRACRRGLSCAPKPPNRHFRPTCRALPPGAPTESVHAIRPFSATYADTSEALSSDSLMGLGRASQGPHESDLFVTLDH